MTPPLEVALPVSTPRRTQASAWALWPTLAVSWIALAQVVSFQGLAIWVVGGSILTALVVGALATSGRRMLAMAAVLAMPIAVAFAADRLGGDSAGPVTRAALMACAVTGAMSLALASRYPATLLGPAVMLLAGALGLGAADEVLWLVGMWVVAAGTTLAMLGPYRRSSLAEHPRLRQLALILVSCGAVAVVGAVLLAPVIDQPWSMPAASQTSASVETPATTSSVAPTAPKSEPAPEEPGPSWLAIAGIIVASLLVGTLVVAVSRRLVVALLWARERRSLERGTREESAAGAWTWILLTRARQDRPLPIHISPDIAADWCRREGEPDVLEVAAVVAKTAFNPGGVTSRTDRRRAWSAAKAAARRPSTSSMRDRWRWAKRTPSQTRSLRITSVR